MLALVLALTRHSPRCFREWTMTPLRDIKSGDAVQSLSFSPKDDKFASCHDDGSVKVWDYNLYKGDEPKVNGNPVGL